MPKMWYVGSKNNTLELRFYNFTVNLLWYYKERKGMFSISTEIGIDEYKMFNKSTITYLCECKLNYFLIQWVGVQYTVSALM